MNKFKEDLTVNRAKLLIGKKIRWQAPIYEGNYGYYGRGIDGGVAIIEDVFPEKEKPLKTIRIEGANADYIFNEWKHGGHFDDPLCYSDGMRYVSFEVVEDEN